MSDPQTNDATPEELDRPKAERDAAAEESTADVGDSLVGSWKFVGTPPTAEQVRDLLLRLPDTFGVPYVDFIEYIQPIPGKDTIKVPHPDRPNLQIDQKVEVWTMYMSVAGRVKMMEAIVQRQGWRVDFEPEPITPTGIPGMLQYDADRIVYREYATIWAPVGPLRVVSKADNQGHGETSVQEWSPIGRKPGTAWVPTSGGKQAARTNPYEKAETSARGRAIAAWGIGVLPGSGVASLEEMQGARDNARREQDAPPQQQENRPREELESEAKMLVAKARQVHGMTETQANQLTAKRLSDMGVISCYDEEADVLDWNKPKAGHLAILIDDLRTSIEQKQAAQLAEDGL